MGDIAGDLSSKRGQISGTDSAAPGTVAIRAQVPLVGAQQLPGAAEVGHRRPGLVLDRASRTTSRCRRTCSSSWCRSTRSRTRSSGWRVCPRVRWDAWAASVEWHRRGRLSSGPRRATCAAASATRSSPGGPCRSASSGCPARCPRRGRSRRRPGPTAPPSPQPVWCRLTRVRLSPTGSKRTMTKVRCARASGRCGGAFQSNEIIFFGCSARKRMSSAPLLPGAAPGSM